MSHAALSVGTDTARPVWFALRQANTDGLVSIQNVDTLRPGAPFGVRIVVHTTNNRSHKAITNSEFVVDGADRGLPPRFTVGRSRRSASSQAAHGH